MLDIAPEILLRNLAARRSPEVLALGCRLRDIVRRAVPDANEVVYHGALCYGRSGKRSELKVYISFHSAHVNLGVYRGAGLPIQKDWCAAMAGKRLIPKWALLGT